MPRSDYGAVAEAIQILSRAPTTHLTRAAGSVSTSVQDLLISFKILSRGQ